MFGREREQAPKTHEHEVGIIRSFDFEIIEFAIAVSLAIGVMVACDYGLPLLMPGSFSIGKSELPVFMSNGIFAFDANAIGTVGAMLMIGAWLCTRRTALDLFKGKLSKPAVSNDVPS